MRQLRLFPKWCVYTWGEPNIRGYNFVGQVTKVEKNCIWIRNIENGAGDPWDPMYVKECGDIFDAIDILYECNSNRFTRQYWAEHIRGRFPNDFDREYDNYKSKKG